jgi:ankyrin repeat protein
LLQQPGIDLNVVNRAQVTALAYCKDPKLVEMLLRHPGTYLHTEYNHRTVLHHAVLLQREVEVIATLLQDPRLNVNLRDHFGATALHCLSKTAYHDAKGVAQLLMRHGAEVNAVDIYGCTAMHYACCTHNHGVVEVLLQTPFIYASLLQKVDGVPPERRRCHGLIPIQVAAHHTDKQSACAILQYMGIEAPSGANWKMFCGQIDDASMRVHLRHYAYTWVKTFLLVMSRREDYVREITILLLQYTAIGKLLAAFSMRPRGPVLAPQTLSDEDTDTDEE